MRFTSKLWVATTEYRSTRVYRYLPRLTAATGTTRSAAVWATILSMAMPEPTKFGAEMAMTRLRAAKAETFCLVNSAAIRFMEMRATTQSTAAMALTSYTVIPATTRYGVGQVMITSRETPA